MCTEVYRHQHIETGGNLFGLWTTSGSAVIHVVLGPGKNCRRTTTSFHQDIEYLERVGRFVNDNYMLCHIGEWHSHHSLSLNKPSSGDEKTVRRYFPQGVSKFLVIIANIKNTDTIELSPYFFIEEGRRYEKAEYVVLPSEGPFSKDAEIEREIQLEAEVGKDLQNETTLVEMQASHYRDSSYKTRSQQNMGANSQQGVIASSTNARQTNRQANQSSTTSKPNLNNLSQVDPPKPSSKSTSYSQADQSQPVSPDIPSGSTPGGSGEPMDTNDTILRPPADYRDANATSENSTSAPQIVTPAGIQAEPDKNFNGGDETPSEREIALKKIHDELKHWFGTHSESVFSFQTSKDCPGAVEISFKHNRKFWMVRFPKGFPVDPTEIFCSAFQESVRFSELYRGDLVKPLNNHVNILLSIKKRCDDSRCNVCKHFTKESLSSSGFSLGSSMENLPVVVNRLADDLAAGLDRVDDLQKLCLTDRDAEITFMHGLRHWIIRFTVKFPDIPATVYYLLSKCSSQEHDAILHGKHSCGPQALNSPKLIIEAIHVTCPCMSCLSSQRQYR